MAASKGNKYAIGNSGGRPPKYTSKKLLAQEVDRYFIYAARKKEPITITGLCLFLGFSHREALKDYEKRKEFSDIIKRARTRVEFEYEKKLSGNSNTGSIFALKNMGWKDKMETALTNGVSENSDVAQPFKITLNL